MILDRWSTVFLAALLLMSTTASVLGRQAGETGEAGIAWGTAVGKAGQELTLPLVLTNTGQSRIGAVALALTFPPALSLVRTELAYPAEQAGAKISTEAGDSGTRFRLAVPKGAKESLPAGPIAFLGFRVADDAQAGKLTVTADAIELTDPDSNPVQAARKSEVQIEVVPREMEPLFACFFYMH